MKRRKKQDKGESEIIRLTNRLEDLLGELGDQVAQGPPQNRPRQTPEPRYSERPVFALGLPLVPEDERGNEGGCIAFDMRTGREIDVYATFGRVTWSPPRQETNALIRFTVTTCPLLQHLCGGRHEYCPLRVRGGYVEIKWFVRANGFLLPTN